MLPTDLTRRLFVAAVCALALVGCGKADGGAGSGAKLGPVSFASGPMVLGEADAPLVLEEFASVTCSHCKHFHDDVMPMIKAEYVAAGLLRFEFYDFPTPPADLSVAGFAIARCAGKDQYFAVIEDLFDNYEGMIRAYQGGSAGQALRAVAARHGLDDGAFDACLKDDQVVRAISDLVSAGEARGINSTPSFFLNGEELTTPASRTAEGMRAILDAKLAELGVEK